MERKRIGDAIGWRENFHENLSDIKILLEQANQDSAEHQKTMVEQNKVIREQNRLLVGILIQGTVLLFQISQILNK